MRKTAIILMMLGIMGLVALPCLAAEEKAAPAKPAPMKGKEMATKSTAAKAPVVKLERVEVVNYWAYYVDAKERRGAPLVLAFVFSIENPTVFKLMLDEIKFAVSFEDAEINSLAYYDDNYIPSKTTDMFRVVGSFDAFVVQGNPNVRESKAREEQKLSQADMVKKWWEGIGDFNFPIKVMGTATLVGPGGKNMIVPFEGQFPPKK